MRKKCLTVALAPALGGLGILAADGGSCLSCHEGVAMGPLGRSHVRVQPFEVLGRQTGCLGCHDGGRASEHAKSGDAALIRAFGKDPAADNAACLSCHGRRETASWPASRHASEDLSCTQCHKIHRASSPEDACAACHGDVAAAFRLPSRHPLKSGKMRCASCHDVHAATEGALKLKTRKNDLCLGCHPSQEGPFVFEHSKVNEDCGFCHAPHGSVPDNLLLANEPDLCLQCHEFHFQANHESRPVGPQTVGGHVFRNP